MLALLLYVKALSSGSLVWFIRLSQRSPMECVRPFSGNLYHCFIFLLKLNSLAWLCLVLFQNFPHETLLAPPVSKSSIESIFMYTVKEADALKHRGAVVNVMLPRDHRQLWLGLSDHAFDQFWAVNRRFMQPFAQNKPRRPRSRLSETIGQFHWLLFQRLAILIF